MTLSEKQRAFTRNVVSLISWAHSQGWEITLGEVYRPKILQYLNLWAKRSQTLKSKHQDRLAIDLNLFIDGKYITNPNKYRPLGEHWESLGGKWGGRYSVLEKDYDKKVGWDSGHFES